jgi:hypothetical protein
MPWDIMQCVWQINHGLKHFVKLVTCKIGICIAQCYFVKTCCCHYRFAFISLWVLGKVRSHTKLNLVSMEGVKEIVIVFVAENSHTARYSTLSWCRIQSWDSLFRLFLPHSRQTLKGVTVVMLVYSLSLRKNFIMHGFMNVEKTVSVLITSEWTVLHVGYVGSGELFCQKSSAWCLCYPFEQSTAHHLFSLKGILSFPWRPCRILIWISF